MPDLVSVLAGTRTTATAHPLRRYVDLGGRRRRGKRVRKKKVKKSLRRSSAY